MRSVIRRLPIVALLVVRATVAFAQSGGSYYVRPACRGTSGSPPSYAQCALRVSGDYLEQGDSGREVSHSGLMSPLTLSPFVIGDSARHFALSYERNEFRGQAARLLAATFITVGLMAAVPPPCQKPRCIGSPPHGQINRPLIGAGLVVEVASLSFRRRANHAIADALRLHNAALAQ